LREDVTQDVLVCVWTDRARWQRCGTAREATLIQSIRDDAVDRCSRLHVSRCAVFA
jgi:DNA-directed RNA polymerase specialized sigma24 family protein